MKFTIDKRIIWIAGHNNYLYILVCCKSIDLSFAHVWFNMLKHMCDLYNYKNNPILHMYMNLQMLKNVFQLYVLLNMSNQLILKIVYSNMHMCKLDPYGLQQTTKYKTI